MRNINRAKRFLDEGMIIISDIERNTPSETIDSAIKRTVEKFKELGIEGTIGVLDDAPDISPTIPVAVIPWKELTEFGKEFEKKEKARRAEWDKVFKPK